VPSSDSARLLPKLSPGPALLGASAAERADHVAPVRVNVNAVHQKAGCANLRGQVLPVDDGQ
jgi:hypothetical protein